MIEMVLGAMVLALWVKVGAAAAADAITTLRASKAGEWGLIDKQRDRKAAQSKSRREAVSKAWQATRARRNRKAGGTGQYRPGMAAYLGDVYHGVWEDQLEKRKAKRANRPAVGPDGKRPAPSRMDQAVEAKVDAQRTKTGYMGRVARALWEPVGENRQPADVAPQPGGRSDGGSAGTPVDPWQSDGDEPTVEIAADGPRIACRVCGDTLTTVNGGWQHPEDSTCVSGYPLTPAGQPSRTSWSSPDEQEAAIRRLQDTASRTLAGWDPEMWKRTHVEGTAMPTPREEKPAPLTPEIPADVLDTARDALARLDPEGRRYPGTMDKVQDAVYDTHPDVDLAVIDRAIAEADRKQNFGSDGHTRTTNTAPTSNGGNDMSTDTVDLVDYNQAVNEHERALEQLRTQFAEACAFEQHVTGLLGAVEAMDAGRSAIADSLAPLSEGMEGSRYGGDATEGSAEATAAMTAGSIAEVQEHIEAAADRNQRWKEELAASIEGVQASLQHIKSQYGEAAATVQETGIDPNALADH